MAQTTTTKAPEAKASEAATTTATATTTTAAKAPAKKAPAKKAPAKKAPAKKAAAKKTAAKPAAKKPAKKTATKTAAKKPVRRGRKPGSKNKVVENVQETIFQYGGNDFVAEQLVDRVKEQYKNSGHRIGNIKSLRIYVNLDERRAYYVINDKGSDQDFIEI